MGSSVPALSGGSGGVSRATPNDKIIDDHLAVQAIIRSYQVNTYSLTHSLSLFVDFVVHLFIFLIINYIYYLHTRHSNRQVQ